MNTRLSILALLVSLPSLATAQDGWSGPIDPERAAAALLARPAAAAAPAPRRHPSVNVALGELHGLGSTPHGLVGFGPDYHVRFTPRGPELRVATGLGQASESVRLELSAVERGELRLWADVGAPRLYDYEGTTVSYVLDPSLVERYEVRADGLEQSVVLEHRPPGTGPLVVRTRLVTELSAPAGDRPSGFELRDATGAAQVRVGAAVAVDADGFRTQMEMRVVGDELVVTVDEATLETARYPLVLDPVLGSGFGGDTPFHIRELDAAYDEAHRVFGCVVHRSGDELAFFFRLSEDGELVDLGFPIDFCAPSSPGVSVANINAGDWFVTAVQRSLNRVYLASFPAEPGLHGIDVLDVPPPAGHWITDFELGGEMLPPYDAALLALTAGTTYGDTALMTQRVTVQENGILVLVDDEAVTQVQGPAGAVMHSLSVAKTGGVAGHWSVAWQEDSPNRVQIATVSWKNGISSSTWGFFGGGLLRDPVCAGDGSRFALVATVGGCPGQGGESFSAAEWKLVGHSGVTELEYVESWSWEQTEDPLEELHPSVDVAGPGYAVGFAVSDYLACRTSTTGGVDWVLLQALRPGGGMELEIPNLWGYRMRTALVSATELWAAPGSPQRALMFAWESAPGYRVGMKTAVLEYVR